MDDSKDIPNWNTADLDDSKWSVPVVVPLPPNVIISADSMEGSRRHSTIAAAAVAMQPTPPPPPPPTPSNEPCGKDCMCGLAAELPPSSNQTVGTVQPHTVYTSFTLKCAPGQRIKSIDFASYGTPTGTCGNFAINPKCHANSSLSVVKGLCEGKLACTVGAANSLFKTPGWDMCPDVLKHLRVEASGCTFVSPPPTPPPTPPPPPPPTFVVRMAELYTGWFSIHGLKGKPGSTVTFQLSTTAGTPMEYGMMDTFTFGPSGVGTFEPRFQYHAIHLITITGLQTMPTLSDIVGYRLTSLGERTGDFSCSSALITAMYHTTVNNYRGLTTGGMTVDCPHRERRGYGGDGHTSYQFGQQINSLFSTTQESAREHCLGTLT